MRDVMLVALTAFESEGWSVKAGCWMLRPLLIYGCRYPGLYIYVCMYDGIAMPMMFFA